MPNNFLSIPACHRLGQGLGLWAAVQARAVGLAPDDRMDCVYAEESDLYGEVCALIAGQARADGYDVDGYNPAPGHLSLNLDWTESPLYTALREGMYEGVREYNVRWRKEEGEEDYCPGCGNEDGTRPNPDCSHELGCGFYHSLNASATVASLLGR